MELGDEVSVKIKSAIRARLKEIGIEWDRELPDYVMVLIANKKSKEQMENDLMIFLGSHTAGFTAWLHNVLKKLEECAISRGLTKRKEEDKKSKTKRRPSDENHQEPKKLKSNDMKSDDNGNSSAGSESEEISNQLSPVRIDEGMDSDVSDFSAPTLAMSDMKLNSLANKVSNEKLEETISNNMKSRISEISEPGTRLKIEPTTCKEEKPKQKIEISWSNEKIDNSLEQKEVSRERKGSYTPRRNRSSSRNQRRGSRSKSRGRGDSVEQGFEAEKHVSILRRGMKENIQKEPERKAYRGESRNIYRRKDSEERRNGYGIKGRHIGKNRGEKDRNLRNRSMSMDIGEDRLPSLVKVTPRPVRHPSMQPSSNLILKAVAEAQKSIATSLLPQPDDKLPKMEEKDNIPRKKVYRKKNIPIFQRENISVTLLNDRVIADKVREEQEEATIFENNIRKQENQLCDGPEVGRFTISLLSDDNDSIIASDYEDANENNGLAEENLIEADENEVQLEEQMDISTTTCAEDSVEDNILRDLTGQRFDRRRLGPRVIPDPNTVLSFPKSPMKQTEDVHLFLPRFLTTCKCCSQVLVLNKGLAPVEDSIMKTIVNENAYDVKMDENGKVIKCKFWPSCEAGNDCRFYHPKEYCRTLPNCKYGQKCLYYHPPCKFADKCLNVTCPYTHAPVTVNPAVKAKVWTKVPLAPSNGQICMYYPNCTKPFCPYQHSYSTATGIPCKFGINCTKVGCEFDHTQLNKNPYKWVAQNPE